MHGKSCGTRAESILLLSLNMVSSHLKTSVSEAIGFPAITSHQLICFLNLSQFKMFCFVFLSSFRKWALVIIRKIHSVACAHWEFSRALDLSPKSSPKSTPTSVPPSCPSFSLMKCIVLDVSLNYRTWKQRISLNYRTSAVFIFSYSISIASSTLFF